MSNYVRVRNSHYANYRYNNPNSASFIAPQGKVANFIFDQIDPSQLAEGAGQAWNAVKGVAGGIGNAAQDLYAQGVAKTGVNLPGMAEQAMQGIRGAGQAVGNAAQDLYAQGVARTGINVPGMAEQAMNGLRGAGQVVSNAASGISPTDAAGLAAAGSGAAAGGLALGKYARGLRGAGKSAANAVSQAPGMMQRAGQAVANAPMAAKIGAGALGAGALGAGAYGVNRMMQDDEAQYGYRNVASAKFSASRRSSR